MKHNEARLELKRVLAEQQTVTTKKLARLLQSMNVTLKEKQVDSEISFLKGEISRLKNKLKRRGN